MNRARVIPCAIFAALVAAITAPCFAGQPKDESLAARARRTLDQFVKPLPARMEDAPATPSQIDLGRVLFFDSRLSRDRDMSCNSCHNLRRYGTPSLSVRRSLDETRRLTRKVPTVYNAASQHSQYWDGRVETIEQQAAAALLNPHEMAMPDEAAVMQRINAVPGYRDLFARAFPDDKQPVTFNSLATALGAFQRGLTTPAPFDNFLKGDDAALTDDQLRGLIQFQSLGCAACHTGPSLGGQMIQKVGVTRPWPNQHDRGRFDITKRSADLMMFKVATLRNVERTWPYFHDNSAITLDEAVRKMAWYELGQAPSDEEVALVVEFLRSLTGERPTDYIAEPQLPE